MIRGRALTLASAFLEVFLEVFVGVFVGVLGGACTPAIGDDPIPGAMQFDPDVVPARVPQPTNLVIDPATGHIDFGRVGPRIPTDCAVPGILSEAECEFDQFLETLNGFPTVSPAQAPASVSLDPTTLTLGDNVVVLSVATGAAVADVDVNVGFDGAGRYLTVKPRRSWALGDSLFLAVRGYGHGVRTAAGAEVVGSPTEFLLKQATPLPCGASDPAELDPGCPAFALLSQSYPADAARAKVFQLEQIRVATRAAGAWDLIAAAGIPTAEVAVLWSFPIQTASVAELNPDPDPDLAIVPRVTAANEIRVAIHGPVDPATVSPYVFQEQFGSVVLMDLDEIAKTPPQLVTGLPRITARVVDGDIVITGAAPFTPGHNVGLFFTTDLHDDEGGSLVPSPVSVLLTLRGKLTDAAGHSEISGVSDADAATLESGRQPLAKLFDSQSLAAITGLSREKLVYCYAFVFPGTP